MPEALTDAAPTDVDAPVDLVGLDRDGLAAALAPLGLKGYRVGQVWQQMYRQGVSDFEAMTTIAKTARAELAAACSLGRLEIASAQTSADGTRKWLFRLGDGALAETVFIPEEDRGT